MIVTLADMLETLLEQGTINVAQRREIVRQARLSGLGVMPVTADDLERLLLAASIKDGRIVPTLEFRALEIAVRSLIDFAPYLQPPSAVPHLGNPYGEFATIVQAITVVRIALRQVWEKLEREEAVTRSTWILNELPLGPSGWACARSLNHQDWTAARQEDLQGFLSELESNPLSDSKHNADLCNWIEEILGS